MRLTLTLGLPISTPLPVTVSFPSPISICLPVSFTPIAIISMPPVTLAANAKEAKVVVENRVRVTDHAGFAEFAKSMIGEKSFEVAMFGPVDVELFGGWIAIRGATLRQSIEMEGMNGLRDVSIEKIAILAGTDREITMQGSAKIENPADVAADLGDVEFDLFAVPRSPEMDGPAGINEDFIEPDTLTEPVRLGSITMPNLKLKPGTNNVSANALFSPDLNSFAARSTGLALLNGYLSNAPQPVLIRGHPKSTRVPYMAAALSTLRFETVLPGLDAKFILRAELILPTPGDLWSGTIRSRLLMRNPFDAPMRISSVKGTVTIPGGLGASSPILSVVSYYLPLDTGPVELGSLNAQLPSPIVLPPNSETISPALAMTPSISLPALTAVLGQLAEGKLELSVDVAAEMGVSVGSYDVTRLGSVGYAQRGVGVSVALV